MARPGGALDQGMALLLVKTALTCLPAVPISENPALKFTEAD
jgi:hypothetical protein